MGSQPPAFINAQTCAMDAVEPFFSSPLPLTGALPLCMRMPSGGTRRDGRNAGRRSPPVLCKPDQVERKKEAWAAWPGRAIERNQFTSWCCSGFCSPLEKVLFFRRCSVIVMDVEDSGAETHDLDGAFNSLGPFTAGREHAMRAFPGQFPFVLSPSEMVMIHHSKSQSVRLPGKAVPVYRRGVRRAELSPPPAA
jgi:hypothetical protein